MDSLLLDSLILKIKNNQAKDQQEKMQDPAKSVEAFPFDPNKVSFNEMIDLGFDSIIAKRVVKYRNNGGSFKWRNDIQKIYDFPVDLYMRIKNLILLPSYRESVTREMQLQEENIDDVAKPELDSRISSIHFDINKADSIELRKIYGIGSVLSRRIIRYRELLGGFVDKDQFGEVYGLKGESLQNLNNAVYIDSLFSPEKIRLNFAEWDDLVKHPYINSKLATDMIRLRSVNGPFRATGDLKKGDILNDSIFYKIIPYLEF
jgi:DNA uptake protein ComE-like DNA-binding protein